MLKRSRQLITASLEKGSTTIPLSEENIAIRIPWPSI